MSLADRLVCGVDVGTGSARAGIFDDAGRLLGRAEHPILINQPEPAHAEHDSEDIWNAVCGAVRAARKSAGVETGAIKGIAFDATCSLVVRDRDGQPLSVSRSGESRWDTLVWLDHRSLAQAERCTATEHPLIARVGRMSPEMQTPKLMWLKEQLPATWEHAGFFFDLADFLSWKATGNLARSQCTLGTKWAYLADGDAGWQDDLLAEVGLADMRERGSLPTQATPVGADLGTLTPEAAQGLGLLLETRVGCGLIDAHAGALGLLGGLPSKTLNRHAALIAGTSSCVMAMTSGPRRFAGAWGPYWGAALPDLWLSEGGQSATGALLDHVIQLTGGGLAPTGETHRRIIARVQALRATEGPDLAADLHVLPDFHGNRSPNADPHALGVVSGLALDSSFDALCRLYWRTAVALALGLRHVLDAMGERGPRVDVLHVTGGHTRNPLLMELYADATGCRVEEQRNDEAVLRGSAMAAASAAGLYPTLRDACAAMLQPGEVREPDRHAQKRLDRDYRIFLEMHRQRRALDDMIRASEEAL